MIAQRIEHRSDAGDLALPHREAFIRGARHRRHITADRVDAGLRREPQITALLDRRLGPEPALVGRPGTAGPLEASQARPLRLRVAGRIGSGEQRQRLPFRAEADRRFNFRDDCARALELIVG
ncbi:hypothetical protein FJ953_15625 [Mesorhizobium sp. B2-3-6]|nr:hypothetical protein FJ443_30465 [Mesorhizobium sp. B2-6-1]TPM19826.1 hypothetical protein FJ953_15625 [Mesorhizobium sp. B2-3-6]